jgi:hypothetical protein
MTGVLVTFIIFVLFPGIILGFILISRYLRYKETQTMIEHGIMPPPPQPVMPIMPPAMPPQPPPMVPPPYAAPMPPPMAAMPVMPPPMPQRPSRAQLTWGFVLTGVGLGLTLALWPIGWIANSASGESGVHFPLGLGPWMLAGFIPLFVGLALILVHVISQPERGVQRAHPGLPPSVQGAQRGPAPPSPFPYREGGTQPVAVAPPAGASAEAAPVTDAAAPFDETSPST